jgi:hypothetical protein
MKVAKLPFLVLMISVLTACVTSRKEIEVPTSVGFSPSNGAKGAVYIGSIADERNFSSGSSENSTPSLDGDASNTSKEEIANIIGRQSGQVGIRYANITLPKGENVIKKMRELIEIGLRRAGYQPSSDPSSPLRADVSITDFWSWLNAGAAFYFKADIGASIKITTPEGRKTISAKGHGENVGFVVKTENFQQAFEPAVADFLNKLASQLDSLSSTVPATTASSPSAGKYSDLRELYELRKAGAITEQEYDIAKRRALSQ